MWAECLFVDLVADIAVLGAPDSEALANQCRAYEALVEAVTPIPITDAPKAGKWPDLQADMKAQLLSLDGRWFPCRVSNIGGPLLIQEAVDDIVDGMSGSPILAEDGSAVGVVSVAIGASADTEVFTEGSPNPRLAYHLPARFLPRFRNSRRRGDVS